MIIDVYIVKPVFNTWSKDRITMFINIHNSDENLPIDISNNNAFAAGAGLDVE